MNNKLPTAIYTDGGLIGVNPSSIGGTWAWVWIKRGQVINQGEGVVTPEELGVSTVTNNVTELLAAVKALQSVPPGWDGTLFTDSRVTLLRITTSYRFAGVPDFLKQATLFLRRERNYMVQLIGGHPTRKELAEGRRARNGLPVSPWNVLCDETCTKLAKDYLNKTIPRSNHGRDRERQKEGG